LHQNRKNGEDSVRAILCHALAMTVLAMTVLAPSRGQSAESMNDAVYFVTYIEVMPNAAGPAEAELKRYRDAGRRDDGNLRLDVLSEIARPNRFVIIEAWRDKTALDAHAQSAGTIQFQEKLKAIEDAPFDERVTHVLYRGRDAGANRVGAIFVVTHIDVVPPGLDACLAALKTMSADTPNDPGNVGYEVLQQVNRANHFTVVEEWTDRKAADAHAMAEHTRAFREKLIPIRGALYDERFYTPLN
jgi:quinol monooxygenase YgiN